MKKLLFPLILAAVGVGGGIGAGLALRPDPVEVAQANPCGDPNAADTSHAEATHDMDEDGHGAKDEAEAAREYIKLNNQFVVPVVADDMVDSLVVMSLSVEIANGQGEVIYTREPKLRDAFLQALFDHANIGGFDGAFTDANNLDVLRMALTETAQSIAGDVVSSVLITDIARQDL